MRELSERREHFGAVVVLATFLFLSALPGTARTQEASAKPAVPQQKEASQYVGSETCKTCHEQLSKQFETTPHWKTTYSTWKGPAGQGCEACHGPGAAHVAGGGDKSKIFMFEGATAEKINERCLSCHASGKAQMNFEHSRHAENGVSCLDCHSVHHAAEARTLLAKEQLQLCYGCHRSVEAQFRMPFHHKVNEGLVKCTDCHNPHGTFLPAQMRSAPQQEAVCFQCHTDKQGPFVFEHEPIKTEGCSACHNVMGSPNPHMLRYANVNQLCLQCHTVSSVSPAPGTPSFHNMRTRFQACTLCHTQIHGSNFDKDFFK